MVEVINFEDKSRTNPLYPACRLAMANIHFFEPLFLLDSVPAPEIMEIWRLDNKIYKSCDFPDQ